MNTFRKDNIEKLVELGFEVFPGSVTYHEFEGSTQLGKGPHELTFYVGDDYVYVERRFLQDFRDIRLISDHVIMLVLEQGLELPDIEDDYQIEGYYIMLGLRGEEALPLYHDMVKLTGFVTDRFNSISHSRELSKELYTTLEQRCVGSVMGVLQPVPEIGQEEVFEQRKARDRKEMVDQLAHLMNAVNLGATQMYGSIIDRIKYLGIKIDYNPGPDIKNILGGKYKPQESPISLPQR